MSPKKKKDHRSRGTKIRQRYFEGIPVFDASEAHFVPLPWLYRKLLYLVPPRQWQIFSWLLMNARQEGVLELDREELMADIGYGSVPKLEVHLKELQERGLIVMASDGRRRFVVIRHPIDVARRLDQAGKLGEARTRVEDFLDEVLEVPLVAEPEAAAVNDGEETAS